MAATVLTGNELARREYSNTAVVELYQKVFFFKHKMFGTLGPSDVQFPDGAEGPPIMVFSDFTKSMKADKLRLPWINKLTGTGVVGQGTLEANEETPTFGYLDIIVEQLRHAAKIDGTMSAVRAPQVVKESILRDLLRNWYTNEVEKDMFSALYKGASAHAVTAGHYSNTAHPNTYYHTGLPAITTLNADHKMSCAVLDFIIEAFEYKAIPRARYRDKEGILVLCHSKQITSLVQDPIFRDIQLQGRKRIDAGSADGHPMFSDADFQYRDCYIYRSERVLDAVSASVTNGLASQYGCLALGAKAMGCGWGGFPNDFPGAENGVGYDKAGNIQLRFAPSDSRDYLENMKWGIAGIFSNVRADWNMISGAADKNQSSLVVWTQESGFSFA